MSVSNGQKANQTTFNNAFMSRLVDTSTVGAVGLLKPASAGCDTIADAQFHHNAHLADQKLFMIVNNAGKITWTGTQLTFSENIRIFSKEWSIENTILASQSPISLADGDSAWITLNRTAGGNQTVSTGSLPRGKDILRLATRIGALVVLWDNTMMRANASAGIGEATVTPTQEVPAGTIDGANVTFTLANPPSGNGAVMLFKDGLIQRQTTDYTIVASTITMVTAPETGADMYVVYFR